MVKKRCLAVACLFFASTFFAAGSFAAIKLPNSLTITLTPSISSPQFLGTSILWTATIQNPPPGQFYDYQFAVSYQNQVQIVKDYNVSNTFTWVPHTVEGTYTVIVTVRDITAAHIVTYPPVSAQYVILPWVTQSGGSAVHPTSHPLVALFSGPPCQAGHTLLVRFTQAGSNVSSTTNSVPCSQQSANFYIAGMLPSTQYLMHREEYGPNLVNMGPDLSFVTGPLSADYPVPQLTVNIPPSEHDLMFPVVLLGFFPAGGTTYWPTASDLHGNVIWYFPGPLFVTRVEPGGNLFSFPDDLTFREYDLAGNETLETNVEILNEQLVAHGYPTMNDFNTHETRRLPNGNILLLGSHDLVSTVYQGGTQQNPVDILGDMILVLDHNLQLVWAWDSFAHDDLSRKATLNDSCTHGGGGCPRFNENFTTANDWLHTNAAQMTTDGNIIISERSQDYVVKVNYQNGHGDGSILWRLGAYGNFTLLNPPQQTCGDPNVFPWFTHQHDAAFQYNARNTQIGVGVFSVFDDGNLRNSQCNGGQDSRGMVMFISEPNRTAFLVTLGDLGGYSSAFGSADILAGTDGIYASFDNGMLGSATSPISQSTETDLNGNIVYQLQANTWSYRTYRVANLYTPTQP